MVNFWRRRRFISFVLGLFIYFWTADILLISIHIYQFIVYDGHISYYDYEMQLWQQLYNVY